MPWGTLKAPLIKIHLILPQMHAYVNRAYASRRVFVNFDSLPNQQQVDEHYAVVYSNDKPWKRLP